VGTDNRTLTVTQDIASWQTVPLVSYTITDNGNTSADGVVGTFMSTESPTTPETPYSIQSQYSSLLRYFVNKVAVASSPITVKIGDVIDIETIGSVPINSTFVLPDAAVWVSNSPIQACLVDGYFLALADKSTPNAVIAKRC
jgi:hypothetical protein